MSRDLAEPALTDSSVVVEYRHRSRLSAMAHGDGVVGYMPPRRRSDGSIEPRGFNVIGTVADAAPYTVTSDADGPGEAQALYRRRLEVISTTFVRIDDVALQLKMTRETRQVPAPDAGILPLAAEDYIWLADLMEMPSSERAA